MSPTSTTNSFLFAMLHSGGQWNVTGHGDSQLDKMIEQQASEQDLTKRRRQLLDIQRYVLGQAYMFSPTAGTTHWVFTTSLKGFYPNTALSEYNYWSRAWLER